MAKKNDQLAGAFETENTGGLLSGLLADEEHLDRRAMFRLGSWGVASVGAVVIAVLANQSAIKTRRDDVASLDLTRQSQQIQSVARESQNETRRLASAIDTLNGDRDRLYSRLTTIEQGLDSVTGAIAKQKVVTAASPNPPPAAPTVSPPASAPVSQPIAQTAAPDPAPAVAPMTAATTPTPEKLAPEKPRAEAKKPAPPAALTAAAALPASSVSSNPPANPPAPSSAAPLMTSKSLMGPPDAAAAKLIEPEPPAKVAAAAPIPPLPIPSPPAPASTASAPIHAPELTATKLAPDKPAAEKVAAAQLAPPPPVAVKHTEFGVDVGGANSVAGLRALWRGLLKSRSNAPLAALQPIIVVKERDNGFGMQLRLVAGPLGDAAAAAKICARLAENEHPCETSLFDGQRLAFKSDEAPARTEAILAKPEKPSTEKRSEEKSAPEAASAEKPEPETPAATKPGSNKYFHRRSYYQPKRAAVVVEDPPKKPETTSSISSFFSSRLHPQ